MAKKTLTEAFEVKPKVSSLKSDVKDYDIFADKNLLEELRIKIVQNLIEENIPDKKRRRIRIYNSSRKNKVSELCGSFKYDKRPCFAFGQIAYCLTDI